MRNSILANALTAIAVMASVPAHALLIEDGVVLPPSGGGTSNTTTGWDLAGDYLPNANPNGPWSYGRVSNGAFDSLAWNAGTNSYGVAAEGQVFVYKNTTATTDFGIGPGKVSLESDWGNAAVRWTAPSSREYSFTIAIGGTTDSSGPDRFGNRLAQYGTVAIDGVDRTSDSFADNVRAWNFTQFVNAGSTVVAAVLNQGSAIGGNTQTDMSVSVVPEPASAVLFGLGIGLLLYRRKLGRG